MKKALLNGLLAGVFLSPFIMADDAEAREYCREYTKSIRVNGRVQSGYGTACQQQDGSWMIVNAQGDVDPFDALRAQNVQIVAQDEPVYYDYGPYYRPVTYYAPVRRRYSTPAFYYSQPGFSLSFGSYGNYGRRDWDHHNDWNYHRDWDHDDDHDGHHGHRRH